MQVDRPVVSPEQTDRVVLWIDQKLDEIKGTYAERYIRWGAKQKFASEKSKAKILPERPSCQGRELWYDLTGLPSGIGFWPKAHKYRHIVPANSYHLICNCNLYDIHSLLQGPDETRALIPILNSTLVGLFKHFYGRYAGSEGTLKTEVVDALLLEVPNPANVEPQLADRLTKALERIGDREVTHLVEQPFLACHTLAEMHSLQGTPLGLPLELQHEDRRELDLLTFELLGVDGPRRRSELVDRLYAETSLYYREQRIQDIQSTINRAKGESRRGASQLDLAFDAWQQLEPEWQQPLSEWLGENAPHAKIVSFPEGAVRLPVAGNFFEATTIYFGQKPAASYVCASRAEAELVYAITMQGLRGPVSIPTTENDCVRLAAALENRLADARSRFEELAAARAGTDELRERVVDLLHKWFVNGKEGAGTDLLRSAKPSHAI